VIFSNSKSRRDFSHIQRRPDVNVGAIRTKPAKADYWNCCVIFVTFAFKRLWVRLVYNRCCKSHVLQSDHY